jgi:amino acid transporter
MEKKFLAISTIAIVLLIIGLIISKMVFSDSMGFFFSSLLIVLITICIVIILGAKKIKKGIKVIVLVVVVFFVIIPIAGYIRGNWFTPPGKNPSPIIFRQENNTLIVTEVKGNLTWDNFIVIRGNATLPNGKVDPGDIITNCSGTPPYGGILVEWLPSKTMLYWGKYFPSK